MPPFHRSVYVPRHFYPRGAALSHRPHGLNGRSDPVVRVLPERLPLLAGVLGGGVRAGAGDPVAAEPGIVGPMIEVRFHEVVVDCADPRSLAEFWVRFTGYIVRHGDDDWVSIGAEDGSVTIGFQRVPEPKTVKNRVHLDFAAKNHEATAREIEALGATRLWVGEDPDDAFVVLADPEGNEFCIVRDDS